MKISIIIPVYNEFPTFSLVLERVLAARLPEGCTKEVIVIDDGSTDGTGPLIRQHAAAGTFIAHYFARNLGKGSAIRTGIRECSGDIVLIQDGDLEYDPSDYLKMVEPIVRGEADVVYGSRFLGNPAGMAFPNRIGNFLLTATANLLYRPGITDEATAYKAFRTSILRRIRFRCRRFEFCPEVTAKLCRLGVRIVEAPISYNGRGVAQGKKIRARDGWEALWTLMRYRFARRRNLIAEGSGPSGAC